MTTTMMLLKDRERLFLESKHAESCPACGKRNPFDTIREDDAMFIYEKMGLCQSCQDEIISEIP